MNDNSDLLANQAFIRSASIHVLSSLIKYDKSGENLVKKAANMAVELNDELNKRFTQK